MYIMPNLTSKLINSKEVAESDKELLKQLKSKIKEDSKSLPTDLMEYRQLFWRYFKFSNLETKTLVHCAHFMSVEPVTGVNTINNILRLFK